MYSSGEESYQLQHRESLSSSGKCWSGVRGPQRKGGKTLSRYMLKVGVCGPQREVTLCHVMY